MKKLIFILTIIILSSCKQNYFEKKYDKSSNEDNLKELSILIIETDFKMLKNYIVVLQGEIEVLRNFIQTVILIVTLEKIV